MNGLGTTGLLVGGATVINVVARAREGKEVASPIIASVILFAALSFIGSVWRWDIIIAIAALFFLSSLIIKGAALIRTTSTLISGASK